MIAASSLFQNEIAPADNSFAGAIFTLLDLKQDIQVDRYRNDQDYGVIPKPKGNSPVFPSPLLIGSWITALGQVTGSFPTNL